MNHNNDQQKFIYTYSAKDRDEIDHIRQKYKTNEVDNKLARLHALDASVHNRATVVAIALGVIGSLIMGTGMSAVMVEEFGNYLGLGALAIPLGIAVGALGIVIAILAYPAYRAVSARRKQKITPEILKLADELEAAQQKNKAESD